MTDFGTIGQYAEFVEQDPFRNGLHYPAVLALLGDLKKRILDVGCGDGRFPRMMASKGATVTGYDISVKKIQEAQSVEDADPLGIQYFFATAQTFSVAERFDDATSVLVLPYASNMSDLQKIFRSAARQLLEGGRFISVIFNPEFTGFGKHLGSRRFHELDGNGVRVEFIEPASGETQFTSELHQYTRKQYECAAIEAGLKTELWEKLCATREAIAAMGEDFWKACHEEQPYAVHVARK